MKINTVETPASETLLWLRIAMICGILGSICYALAIFVSLPFRASYLFFFAFGPLMLAGVIAIYHYLRTQHDGVALKLGTVFLVFAAVTVTQMATMQGVIRGHYREARAAAETDQAVEKVRGQFLMADTSQQGLDMAFDLFVSTGTFLLAAALLSQPRFGRLYAVPGMAVAATGLFLNLISFPTVNAGEAGYIDPAPFFAVFYSALSLKFLWEWIQVERGRIEIAG